MSLQHTEDVVTQRVSVELFAKLAADSDGSFDFSKFTRHAQLHLELIERFVRFPHRNEILGRRSTSEEINYLEGGGERFGQ